MEATEHKPGAGRNKGGMLTQWALRAHSQGMPMAEIHQTMHKMRRKSSPQILAILVAQEKAAV